MGHEMNLFSKFQIQIKNCSKLEADGMSEKLLDPEIMRFNGWRVKIFK